jgi:hypothetical protein
MKTTDILLLAVLGAVGYLLFKAIKNAPSAESAMINIKQESRMDFGGGGGGGGGGGMPFGNFFS